MGNKEVMYLVVGIIVVALLFPMFEGGNRFITAVELQKVFCLVTAVGEPMIVCDNSNDTLNFIAGTGIIYDFNEATDSINITSTGGIENQGTNVGAGKQVYKDFVNPNLRFRTLLNNSGILLDQGTDELTFSLNNIPKSKISTTGTFDWAQVSKSGSILNDIGAPTSAYSFGSQRLTSLGVPTASTDASRSDRMGIIGTLATTACADNEILKYDLGTTTWACDSDLSSSGLTSINGDATAAQVLSGTANQIVITDTGAGTLQWDVGTDIVQEDIANTYVDANMQTFTDDDFRLQDNTGGQFYTFSTSDLVADRVVTLPLLGASDTFVFEAFSQTLTNKAIDADLNTITDIDDNEIKALAGIAWSKISKAGSSIHDIANVTSTGCAVNQILKVSGTTWQCANDSGGLSSINGDSTAAQVFSGVSGNIVITDTGAGTLQWDVGTDIVQEDIANTYVDANMQTFTDDDIRIQDNTGGQFFTFSTADLAADRVITLPLLGASDTFVFEAFSQTLTNKAMDADLNTITDIDDNEIKTAAGIAWSKISKVGSSIHDIANVTSTGCAVGQILKVSGTTWQCATDAGGISSINGDSTAAQVFSGVAGNIVITDTGAGTLDFDVGSTIVQEDTANTYTGTSQQDFGTNFITFGSDPADAGNLRLSNTGSIAWESDVAGTDITLSVDASEDVVFGTGANNINFNSNPLINTVLNADGTGNSITNIEDADIKAAANIAKSKISTTGTWVKADLPATTVYTDQANIFGDFDQTFKDNRLRIENPAGTFEYQITADAIAADRILNLPLTTGTDTIAVTTLAQTLTDKTLGTGTIFSVIPTINDGITFTFNPSASVAGLNVGALAGDISTPVNGDIWYDSTANKFRAREGGTSKDMIGGGSGITSINGDATAAQVFSGVAGNIVITDTGAGTLEWDVGSTIVQEDTANVYTGTSQQDFGTNFITFGADPADAGNLRLSNTGIIGWESDIAGTDITLSVDASEDVVFGTGTNNINFNSNPLINTSLNADGTGNSITNIEDADIKSGANIAKSKISTTGTWVKADLPASVAYEDEANVFTLNQELERTSAIPTLNFDRPEVVVDDTTIADIVSNGLSSTSVARQYAKVSAIMEDDTNTAEDGSLLFGVMQGGTLTNYMQLNDAAGSDIDLLKPVNFNSQNIANMGTLNTHTIPAGTDTFALLAASQTLTSKTLGTGTIFSVIPTINDGITFTFNPSTTVAGLNVGALAGDISTPVNGDIWYDSTANKFRAREGGTSKDMIGTGGGGITSINGDTTAAQVLSGTANQITITDTGLGTLQWDVGTDIVQEDIANTYVDANMQTFTDDDFRIGDNTGGQFYTVSTSDLVADRVITLPLLGAADTFVFANFAQTLDAKTLTGLVSASSGADPADAGVYRLSNNEVIGWESDIAGTDITLSVDASENVVFGTGANNINFNSNPLINTVLDADGTGNSITNIEDADIKAAANIAKSKISTTGTWVKADLPATTVYTDQANIFGDFDQTFKDNRLRIENPAGTFEYQITADAIAADRILNLPLTTGTDTIAVTTLAQTLDAKTLTGLVSASSGADPADAGIYRLSNAQTICWEADVAGTDICVSADSTESFLFDTNWVNINLNSNPLTNGVLGGQLNINAQTFLNTGTITFPTATTTLVGTNTVDTLTNKVLRSAGTGNTVVADPRVAILTAGGATLQAATTPARTTIDATNMDYVVLDFDTTTAETVIWNWEVPDGMDAAANIVVRVRFSVASGTAGVCWDGSWLGRTDSETVDATFGTVVGACDSSTGTNAIETATITFTSAEHGLAAGDSAFFKLTRDVADATDTNASDARLIDARISWS